jgi:Tol biopolymer transport system component
MLDWSGANDLLVFTAYMINNPNNGTLFTVRSNGTDASPIMSFDATYSSVNNPRFSPNGATIAFERTEVNAYRSIFLIDANGQSVRKFWDLASRPCWSADGNFLMANVTYPEAGEYGEDVGYVEIKGMVGNYSTRQVFFTSPYPGLIDWQP